MRQPRLRIAATAILVPLALSVGFVSTAEAKNRAPECVAGAQWTSSTRSFVVKQTKKYRNNDRKNTQSQVFTTTTTSATTVKNSKGVEAAVGGGFGPFQASVKGQLGQDVTESQSVTSGVTTNVTIPKNRLLVVRSGVLVYNLRGVYLVDPATTNPLVTPILRPVPGLPAGCTLKSLTTITSVAPYGTDLRYNVRALKKKK